METIEIIKKKISDGVGYGELAKEYPLTKNGFKILGGVLEKKKKIIRDKSVALVYGGDLKISISTGDLFADPGNILPRRNINRSHMIGTLLGDASLVISTDSISTRSFYYMLGHTWRQISYMKLNYEILKPYVSNVRLYEPRIEDGFKDYALYLNSVSSSDFKSYYDLFYTYEKEGRNPLKFVLRDDIANSVDLECLAYWLMDDGNHRSSAKGVFEITIGSQPYYKEEDVKRFVDILNNNLGLSLYYCFGTESIEIYNKVESSEKVIELIAPYLLPDMSYKLGIEPDLCGGLYREETWFKVWEDTKRNIEHPLMEKYTLQDFHNSEDPIFIEKYKRSLCYRTQVRGFPYPDYSEEGLKELWVNLVNSSSIIEGQSLKPNHNLNRFPSFFTPNRFKCSKKGHISPYSVFHDKKELKRVLDLQLKSKDNINNTNIRNALGAYGAPVVAQFNPAYARYLISNYCPEGGDVLDPCAGWGSRLASAVSLGRGYYGIDQNIETIEGLNSMLEWFSRNSIEHKVKLVQGCAEESYNYGSKPFDMALTSPPFFDKEHYSSDRDQSDKKYGTFEEWGEGFLRPMCVNVLNSLKDKGVFVLNVVNYVDCPLAYLSRYILRDVGFSIKDILYTKSYMRPIAGKSLKEEFIIAEALK